LFSFYDFVFEEGNKSDSEFSYFGLEPSIIEGLSYSLTLI